MQIYHLSQEQKEKLMQKVQINNLPIRGCTGNTGFLVCVKKTSVTIGKKAGH